MMGNGCLLVYIFIYGVVRERACEVKGQPAEFSSHLQAYGFRNQIQILRFSDPSH